MAKLTTIFEIQDNMSQKLRTINSELQKTATSIKEANDALASMQNKNVNAKVTIDDEAAKKQIADLQAQLNAIHGGSFGRSNTGSGRSSNHNIVANISGNALKNLDTIVGGLDKITRKSWNVSVKIAKAPFDMLEKGLSTLTSFNALMVGMGATKAFEAALQQPISLADEYTKAMISFTSQTGSAAAASKLMQQVQQFAIQTPFSTRDVIDNAKFMLTQGFDQSKIIPYLTNIGDANAAVGGNEDSMKRIVVALGQLKQNGKLDAQDMNQLTNANIPAWQYIANSLHTDVGHLRAFMEKGGKIESGSAIQAILDGMNKQFGGTMQKTANSTIEGLWNQITDMTQQKVVLPWGKGLQTALLKPFQEFNTWLEKAVGNGDKVSATMTKLGEQVGDWLGGKLHFVIGELDKLTSPKYANLSIGDKIKIAWQDVIVTPLENWWNTSGQTELSKIAASIGTGLGSFIHTALMTAFGTLAGDNSVGRAGTDAGSNFFSNFIKALKPGDLIKGLISTFGKINADAFSGKDGLLGGLLVAGLDIMILAKLANVAKSLGLTGGAKSIAGLFGGGNNGIGMNVSVNGGVAKWVGKELFIFVECSGGGGPSIEGEGKGGKFRSAGKWGNILSTAMMIGEAANIFGFGHGNSSAATPASATPYSVTNPNNVIVPNVTVNIPGQPSTTVSGSNGSGSASSKSLGNPKGHALPIDDGSGSGAKASGTGFVPFNPFGPAANALNKGNPGETMLDKLKDKTSGYLKPSENSELKQMMIDTAKQAVKDGRATPEDLKYLADNKPGFLDNLKAFANKPWVKGTGEVAGKIATPVMLATDAYSIATAPKEQKGQAIGSAAGGWAGAAAGAEAGAAIGAFFGGVGAIPGAIIGSIVGGIAGSYGGGKLGDSIQKNFNSLGQKSGDKFNNGLAQTSPGMAFKTGIDASFNSIPQTANKSGKDTVTSFTSGRDSNSKNIEMLAWATSFLVNPLSTIGITFTEVAANVVGGLTNGLNDSNNTNSVIDAITSLATSAIRKFKEIFGIKSPSRVMHEMGGFIAQGLINGLNAGNIVDFMESHFGSLLDTAKNMGGKVGSFLSGIGSDIAAAFTGGGNVQSWLTQAMKLTGTPMQYLGALTQIAMHESGGDPNAVNNWDSNAKAGHPSKGLMQTIDSTFKAYMMSGHGDIFNPVDNAVAAINYMNSRYGGINNVPGIQSMANGGGYVGYANGGIINGPQFAMVGEAGPEAIIPLSPNRRGRALSLLGATQQKLGLGGTRYLGATGTNGGAVGHNIQITLSGDNHFHNEADVEQVVKKIEKMLVETVNTGGHGSYGF